MFEPRPRFHFDFVDPGSLVMLRRLEVLDAPFEAVGFEFRPPPRPLVDPDDPAWIAYWDEMAPQLRALGVAARRPSRIPWTRKAHELLLHAGETESAEEVARGLRDRLFGAYVAEGADLGRIDVVVALAVEVGLDRTAARAVLDVDRWREEVERIRADAEVRGVRGVPTLVHGGRLLEGVHDEDTIRAFLGDG